MLNRIAILSCGALAITLTVGATPAKAQGFISPFIGYDFGGDSGCPEIAGCEDKKLNVGVAIGRLRSIFGFETELGYAKNFFREAPGMSSSVLTVMSNFMVAPKIGPVRPYGVGGVGLMRTNVDFSLLALLDSSNNHFGWNIGGGLMVFAGKHFGVRGDIRHFHAFQDLKILGFPISDTKLDFGRASAAVILKF